MLGKGPDKEEKQKMRARYLLLLVGLILILSGCTPYVPW